MRFILAPLLFVLFPIFAVLACSGGSDSSGSSGGTSGTTSGEGSPPGSTCVTAIDGGSVSSSSRVCAPNPNLAGCRLCLEVPGADSGTEKGADMICVFPCRMEQAGDCPPGQTCTAQPQGSRSSGGTCRDYTSNRDVDSLGFCR